MIRSEIVRVVHSFVKKMTADRKESNRTTTGFFIDKQNNTGSTNATEKTKT